MKLKRMSDLAIDKIPHVAGVINISPESFYGGSVVQDIERITSKIKDMAKHGAKIIDIGAMSTRPVSLYGGIEITSEDEFRRFESVLPKVTTLCDELHLVLSVDTQNINVVKLALKSGVMAINDISGLKFNSDIANLISEFDADIVLMACNTKPGDPKSVIETIDALKSSISIAKKNGIKDQRIYVDPAFGGWQGRGEKVDLELIKNYSYFSELNYPLYIGVSRKSTIKSLNGGDLPEDRLIGSIVLTNHLAKIGVDVIRTHDVRETVLGLKTQQALLSL